MMTVRMFIFQNMNFAKNKERFYALTLGFSLRYRDKIGGMSKWSLYTYAERC